MAPPATTPYAEAWLTGFDGHRFYTRTWAPSTPPKAVMLYVHGFGDHIARYDHVHDKWPQRGVVLFAYDLRGFGRTALDEEHRSPDAAYGKTSRDLELWDVEWWLRRLMREYPGLPLFLMGYSAGGGLTLAFPTRTHAPPESDIVSKLSGVIANAPLVHLTHQPSSLTRMVAKCIAKVVPWKAFPAPQPEERFSRKPGAAEALRNDPWRKPFGTAKGLSDMVTQGYELLETDYRNWPKDLPLLITHGTADEVNCPKAAEEFFKKVDAQDKKLVLYPDCLHELVNEIDDIPDRVIDEYLTWIESHV